MTEYLKSYNTHIRDSNIQFFERGHKYKILSDPNSHYTSVTTLIHKLFPQFDADNVIRKIKRGKNWNESNKYWGKSDKEIKDEWSSNGKASAKLGTLLHEKIEHFMNTKTERECIQINILEDKKYIGQTSQEWEMFEYFVMDHPTLKPFRTEWLIYDEELKLAGSIDMVYKNEDGSVSIYDWKRCKEIKYDTEWNDMGSNQCVKHIPNTNFWHYSLQLNIYRKLLEKNYGLKVKELFLVQLHRENEGNKYQKHEVQFLDEEIDQLFKQRLNNIKI